MTISRPGRIISGGQTGVDRAALDYAIEAGIPWGGWAPKGWRATNGTIPLKYREHMREATIPGYPHRTKLNVEASTTTVILSGWNTRGTNLTINLAAARGRALQALQRPFAVVIDMRDWGLNSPLSQLQRKLDGADLTVLNIAGPSEENVPGVYTSAFKLLRELWAGAS